MPGKDLGTKHACFKCSTKFYDMKKPVPVCPKCGADQRESPALKPSPAERRVKAPVRAPEPVVEPIVEEEDAEEEIEDREDEEDAADDA
jgi:uncharacterized protein (TIGR02300 family)